MCPRVLRVETGLASVKPDKNSLWAGVLDYQVYASAPRWWRRLEEMLHIDIILALCARRLANQYDIIWADSEKVGIPLAIIGMRKPMVVLVHHMASRRKRKLLRMIGVTKKWAGIGYLSDADRDFMESYYEIPPNLLFKAATPNLGRFTPAPTVIDGPIMSLGVTKRDYGTLIAALEHLPGYETKIHVSSRYGDSYKGSIPTIIPDWVRFESGVSDEELVKCYQRARFVVLPLMDTTHFTAGYSVALEASASGKAVIATKTPGMASYVIDGVTGILVPPYDINALRTAIHKLWTQPDLAHQMGLAGRRYIETQFNPEVANATIEEFLIKVYSESQLVV